MEKKIIAGIAAALIVISGCGKGISHDYKYKKSNIENIDYRYSMREFVKKISDYSKEKNDKFIVIQQNAEDILPSKSDEREEYLKGIDGIGREDVNYGYDEDNKETDKEIKKEMIKNLNVFRDNGKKVLAVDYCYDKEKMLNSYKDNEKYGYISFAADERNLNNIPKFPESIYNENSNDIETLDDAKNFLYLINPEKYQDKKDFINEINETNYDVVIIDAFFNSDIEKYTKEEINSMKHKKNGGKRLIISYMSIGECEDYRFYWNEEWKSNKPKWLEYENNDWSGNYIVKYWNKQWQDIIVGKKDSYIDKILDMNFDGVYLDIVDGYYNFEE
ncbi:endo alpha-1,4 polygalactosaminidase [Clostridium bornimense]|uniref:endo alpha-1,4 polygalactosaminidase n=1 Tax=Clostridium bornimense TaxID=1216932 RepID=UPI001C0F53A2|nr:endo alpha-1,4 polygalactosaminidase [Clostridium bornimense]MBU5316158.1 endo alpha-1,4 polygalactosaminidase [Clostridium bornimense]